MGLRHDLAKNFRSKPPNKINFDDLNSQTKQVLTTLGHAAEALVDENGGTEAVEAVANTMDRNWSLIWPWMDVVVRAVQENPSPSTSEGFQVLQTFCAMASVILVYPASNPAYEDDRESQEKLAHLVGLYPTVLPHLMSIWVRATEFELGHGIVAGALHAIALCLEALTGNEQAFEQAHQRALQGEVLKAFGNVIHGGKLNVSRTFLKGIAHELSLPSPDFKVLYEQFLFSNISISSASVGAECAPWNAAVSIRLVCSILEKLSLPSHRFRPYDPRKQSSTAKAMCLVECLHFIAAQLGMDAYLGIPVVDGGLLLHICKLKGVIADHLFLAPDKEQKYTTMLRSPFFHTSSLFHMLARCSMHRPVAVRVWRSLQKIENLGLDNWDGLNDRGTGLIERIKEAWKSLKDEAGQRAFEGSIYWGAEARDYCENANCPNTHAYGVTSYYRCSGCKSSVYCSYFCQKVDWKSSHKEKCQLAQSAMRDGLYFRLPGILDMALLQFSFVSDLEHNDLRSKAKAAFDGYLAKHGVEPVIWVDYRRSGPAKVDAFSVEESRQRGKEFGDTGPIEIDETEEGVLAYGIIPFRAMNLRPLLVSYRDLDLRSEAPT
ncbi:hypothetical protein AAF712_004591 [Marasmius tenuissimus]|uniref:MYND-type domain-containing protein n=1 Tax=Marasmius tenuissimus TaxID=585030 RepID=A0ABR3A4C3_9AGAR